MSIHYCLRIIIAGCLSFVFTASCDQSGTKEIISEGGQWVDESTGLIWQQNPSDGFASWEQAMEYCDLVVVDGDRDWRLPTISELRTLVRGCQDTVTGGQCEVSDDCSDNACQTGACYNCVYGDGPNDGCFSVDGLSAPCNHYWSSTQVTEYDTRAWAIGFSSGFIYKPRVPYAFHARCVRSQ